jgi:hypothetical protein
LIIIVTLSCDTGIEVNMDCILKHTTEVVKLESSYKNIEKTYVNLSWTWVLDTPDGDGVIVERKIDADFDSIGYVSPIESLMTFFDTSGLLVPESEVFYKLGLRSGGVRDSFCTVNFKIPEDQHFYRPDAEMINLAHDTLEVIFHKLQDFNETDVALYETPFSSIDSLLNTPVSEILAILTNPIFDSTITDTLLFISGADTLFTINAVYVIKISSSTMGNLDYITDTSIGLRAFLRIQ